MPEDTNGPSGFKVVDRRSFTADGSRVGDQGEGEEQPKASPAVAAGSRPQPEPAPEPEASEPEASEPEGSPEFEALLSSLSTTAMLQLGMLEGPGGERIPPDLVSARQTIDLVEMLQQKTRGNLTAAESKLLEDVLYELRWTYVEIQKRITQKSR